MGIKRTQFGNNLKLKSKYPDPYLVATVKYNDRYAVGTSYDLMKL